MKQRVLITGGSDGLGRALGRYYRSAGDDVWVIDIQEPNASEGFEFVAMDMSAFSADALKALKDPFDIVICNAGISVSGDFVTIPDDKEDQVMDINFTGHRRLIKYLLSKQLINHKGRIAFVCSATQYLSFPIALTYSASKGAMDGFAQALESYLTAQQISVTRIYPGPMNTAHSKYYPGAATEGGRRPEQSVPSIVRGIERRKRKVCPDPISRFYRVASRIAPRQLARKTYTFYKDRLQDGGEG